MIDMLYSLVVIELVFEHGGICHLWYLSLFTTYV